jgi:hypothetical protein
MCYLLSYATMKIYPNITAAFDSAEIRFLLACDDAIGEASAKKKRAQAIGLPEPVMQRTRKAHQTTSTNAI